jgi:hypothetical protein
MDALSKMRADNFLRRALATGRQQLFELAVSPKRTLPVLHLRYSVSVGHQNVTNFALKRC